MSTTDTENFAPLPPADYRLPLRVNDPASYAAALDEADEAPCRTCCGSPGDPRHGSKYHGSEVANQHEYEAADEPRCTCRPSPTREMARRVGLP